MLAALVGYVGRENFFAGIKNYLAAHARANATLADLLAELERTSGRDLGEWTRLWLQEAGVTTLRLEIAADDDGVISSAAVVQEIPAGSPASLRRFLRLGRVTVVLEQGNDFGKKGCQSAFVFAKICSS